MSKQTLITSRDNKGRHAVNLFAIEYDKAKLDETRAQRLNEHGGELQAGISKLIAGLSASDKFKDEKVKSSYEYPSEYRCRPIEEQVERIAKIFNLDPQKAYALAKKLPELPEGAEEWFAIPSLEADARVHFPEVTDPAEKYCRAVQLVHEKIAASREFYNYRDGQITPDRLRVHVRTAEMLAKVTEGQEGDILIIAAQFGLRHRGHSVRGAREVFVEGEFGLGAFAVGSMALVHPERFVRWGQLHTNYPGDEFAPEADGDFSYAPISGFIDGKVRFDVYRTDYAYEHYGSVSAFLPPASPKR